MVSPDAAFQKLRDILGFPDALPYLHKGPGNNADHIVQEPIPSYRDIYFTALMGN